MCHSGASETLKAKDGRYGCKVQARRDRAGPTWHLCNGDTGSKMPHANPYALLSHMLASPLVLKDTLLEWGQLLPCVPRGNGCGDTANPRGHSWKQLHEDMGHCGAGLGLQGAPQQLCWPWKACSDVSLSSVCVRVSWLRL